MNYAYYGTGGIRKMLYQDIDEVYTSHDLVKLYKHETLVNANPMYTRVIHKLYAIIRLGAGERLVRDES